MVQEAITDFLRYSKRGHARRERPPQIVRRRKLRAPRADRIVVAHERVSELPEGIRQGLTDDWSIIKAASGEQEALAFAEPPEQLKDDCPSMRS
jgi:hypothetical protein